MRSEISQADDGVHSSNSGDVSPHANFSGGRSRIAQWSMVGAVLLLVGVPVLYAEMPKEVGRWHFAAALEKHLDGDLPGAIGSLDRALHWDPQQAPWYLERAQRKREVEDYAGSLADCQQALQLQPREPSAYLHRSLAWQYLGRHAEAVDDWKFLEQLSQEPGFPWSRATVLNGLAYARALGSTELDEALAQVEQALRLAGPNSAMLDTRGYIRYLQGDLPAARSDLEMAVQQIERQYRQHQAAMEREKHKLMDLRELRLALRDMEHSIAVIRYHRALIYDRLELHDQAEADRQRVRRLGHEPDERLF